MAIYALLIPDNYRVWNSMSEAERQHPEELLQAATVIAGPHVVEVRRAGAS